MSSSSSSRRLSRPIWPPGLEPRPSSCGSDAPLFGAKNKQRASESSNKGRSETSRFAGHGIWRAISKRLGALTQLSLWQKIRPLRPVAADANAEPQRQKRPKSWVQVTPPLAPLGIEFTPVRRSLAARLGLPTSPVFAPKKLWEEELTTEVSIPSVPSSLGPQTDSVEFWRVQLDAIYARRNPKKRHRIRGFLQKYHGREVLLYRKVCHQYSLDPTRFYADARCWEERDVEEDGSASTVEDSPCDEQCFDDAMRDNAAYPTVCPSRDLTPGPQLDRRPWSQGLERAAGATRDAMAATVKNGISRLSDRRTDAFNFSFSSGSSVFGTLAVVRCVAEAAAVSAKPTEVAPELDVGKKMMATGVGNRLPGMTSQRVGVGEVETEMQAQRRRILEGRLRASTPHSTTSSSLVVKQPIVPCEPDSGKRKHDETAMGRVAAARALWESKIRRTSETPGLPSRHLPASFYNSPHILGGA